MKKKIFFIVLAITLITTIHYYFSYPKILRNISKADKIGIVKKIHEIKIQNVKNPINASIENYKDNYILVFRINEKKDSYIALSFLDKNLNQIGSYKKIDIKSTSAEDPRIFKYQNDYFLIYNDKLPIKHHCRAMHLSKIKENTFEIDYTTVLDQHIKAIEKNWVPFISKNKLFLAYNLMPHKILGLVDPTKNSLDHLVFENNPCFSRFFWKWGEPRGGTSAKLVDGEFLAFFHSCFGKNKKRKFYVMGAYTFQAYPPYKVTKVSKFPLVFGKNKKTRVYFPTGFVVKNDLIYLSFGENDNISKIAIIDKAKLFENMKNVY